MNPQLDFQPLATEGPSLDFQPKLDFEPAVAPDKSLLEKIGKGIKRSLAPMSLSREELRETSVPEVAAQVVTDVGTSVAATALGGPIGAGLLGLYKGAASEIANARARDRDVSPIGMLFSIGSEIVPVLGQAGKISRPVAAAGTALAQGADTYFNTQDATLAGVASALGAVGGALSAPAKRAIFADGAAALATPTSANPNGRVPPKVLEDLAGLIADDSYQVEKRVADAVAGMGEEGARAFFQMPQSVLHQLRTGLAEAETEPSARESAINFVRYIAHDPEKKIKARKAHSSAGRGPHWYKNISTMSDELLGKKYSEYRMSILRKQALEDVAEEAAGRVAKDPHEGQVWESLKPMLYIGRAIDDKLGTNLEGVVRGFSEAKYKMTVASSGYFRRAEQLLKQGDKLGITREEVGHALNGTWSTKFRGEKARELLDGWRTLYDEVRDAGIAGGTRTGRLENYFNQISKKPGYFLDAMQQESERVGKIIKDTGAKDLYSIPEATDFVKVLEVVKGSVARPENVTIREIPELLQKLREPRTLKKFTGFEASTAFRREGSMPAFVRDFDVGNAFRGYVNTTLKPIYFNDLFERAASHLPLLRGAGFKNSEKILGDYIQSLSGAPSNFNAWMQAFSARKKAAALQYQREATTGLQKAAGKAAEMFPDFINWSTSLVYPNTLGYSLYAPLRNLTQPLMTTAPEIGGGEGYNVTVKGVGRAWSALRKMKDDGNYYARANKFLQERGLAPGDVFSDSLHELSQTLRGVPVLGPLIKGTDAVNELGMKFYSSTDVVNRFITYHIGQEMAERALRSPETYKGFFQRLSAGAKAEMYKALRKGDTVAQKQEALGDFLAHYLIAKTQFNYGREAIHKFGRDYGKLASMFTTWPTMIANDMAEIARKQRPALNAFQKYLAPITVLSTLDAVMDDEQFKDSPVWKLLVGKGLLSLSPMSAVLDLSVPPLVKLPVASMGALKSAIEGDWAKAGKEYTQAWSIFAPGAGVISKSAKTYQDLFEE